MTDNDLIARLRGVCTCNIDSTPCMAEGDCRDAFSAADRIEALIVEKKYLLERVMEQDDRIEALTKERDEALEWLSASQGYIADAVFALDKQEKAEAYAEELEKERDDYAHKLMQANNTYTEMHLEIERLRDKLAKAVEALERAKVSIENGGGGGVVDVVWLDGPCPETLCDFIDATLAEIRSEAALNKGAKS